MDIVQPKHPMAGIADVLRRSHQDCPDVYAGSVTDREGVHLVTGSDTG